MQRAKFTPELIEQAVRQVIYKGSEATIVTKRLSIGYQILYTSVKNFKDVNELVDIDVMN